jgi:hypothetical protein
MRRFLVGAAVLLLAVPLARALDDPKKGEKADKPASPDAQYKALTAEYDRAVQEFFKEYQKAKTDDEKKKLAETNYPKAETYAPRFLKLAEDNPKTPAAGSALVWVMQHTANSFNNPDAEKVQAKAAAILLRDHLDDGKLIEVFPRVVHLPSTAAEQLLRQALEKSTNREVKANACFYLAQYQKNLNEALAYLKDPEMVKQIEQNLGAETLKRFRALDPAKLAKEAEDLFERTAREYGDLKHQQGTFADAARRELFELHNLVVGKVAPEIEGEDIDGVKFKLSDYRGKVVLLDFWGHW